MRELTYAEAVREALRQEMERDERVFVIGEDVGVYGGAFGVTLGLVDEFGEDRVIDTPISEYGIAGAITGAALTGMRPVGEIMFMDFTTFAMEQLVNQAAKMRFMFGGMIEVPFVLRCPAGSGTGAAAQHSQSLENWFVHVPGLKVVMPTTPYDVKGLLIASIRDDNPVIFVERKLLYKIKGAVPEESYTIPLGAAEVKREGKDLTVVATGVMVKRALEAAEQLTSDGVDIEVVDPRTLKPLDEATIVRSVAKTGRVLIVHEASQTGGYGGEVAAVIAESEAFDYLDAPIVRLAGRDMPIPYNRTLEYNTVPHVENIVEAARQLVQGGYNVAVPVIMPKLEMSQETATVIEWTKFEGDRVEKGEPLLTVETDKVTVEVESPASGILAGVSAEPQQVVPVTEIIAYVLEPGEALLKETRAAAAADQQTQVTPVATAATPVAQRMAAAHGVELSNLIGTGPGQRITKEDVEAALTPAPGSISAARPGKVRATPAARRVARERGVDLGTVTGTGPRGRVQAADILSFVPDVSPTIDSAAYGTQVDRIIPLQGMRRTIAERMTFSYQTAPHITLTTRVDMSGFEETRSQLNAKANATGQARVSATALIVRAVSWALTRHPWLNSTLQDELIHLLADINIGVAVALEEGLIVPVVHQADRKSVSQIAAEVNDLSRRARDKQLTPADVADGTFTVTNLGPLGIEQFTAIINPPQAAILAVGAMQKEVMVLPDDHVQDATMPGDLALGRASAGNGIVVRPVMRMTLSVDHRIIDGAVAAHFFRDLREGLEKPALLLW